MRRATVWWSSFGLSMLFHLLLGLGVTVSWVLSPAVPRVVKDHDPPPAYVPSYAYMQPTKDVDSKGAASAKTVESRHVEVSKNGILKPNVNKAPAVTQPSPYKNARFSKQSLPVDVTKPDNVIPMHLIGEDKIIKPIIKIVGKSLTAHLVYPKIAVDFELRGRALVGFMLHPDGQVTDVQLVQSSTVGPLDDEAVAAVKQMSPLQGVAPYLKEPDYMVIGIIFG